jgi:hypothetical protein
MIHIISSEPNPALGNTRDGIFWIEGGPMLGRTIERLKALAARLAPEFSWANHTKADKKGELPLHGRASLMWDDGRTHLRLEWNLWSSFAHAGFEVDPMESEAKVYAAIPPVAVWLTLSSWPLMNKLAKKLREREASISFHDGSIWWKAWTNPNHYSSKTPRWRDGSLNLADLFLGGETLSREPVGEPLEVEIPMPEGVYLGRSTIERLTWRRPRWFLKHASSATVTVDPRDDERFAPIPVPGKGETGYDLDEDAIYSSSCRASTHHEAVGELVASVLRRRYRYGGTRWRPEGGPHGTKAGGGGSDPADPEDDRGEPLETAKGASLDAWARHLGTERGANENCDALRERLMMSKPTPTARGMVRDVILRVMRPFPFAVN